MAKSHRRNASLFLYFVRSVLAGKIGAVLVLLVLMVCFSAVAAYLLGSL